jgi:hypothetical protein
MSTLSKPIYIKNKKSNNYKKNTNVTFTIYKINKKNILYFNKIFKNIGIIKKVIIFPKFQQTNIYFKKLFKNEDSKRLLNEINKNKKCIYKNLKIHKYVNKKERKNNNKGKHTIPRGASKDTLVVNSGVNTNGGWVLGGWSFVSTLPDLTPNNSDTTYISMFEKENEDSILDDLDKLSNIMSDFVLNM